MFFLVVHHQETAKTAIIKPVALTNQPSAKFDSCTLALGGTSDSCGFSCSFQHSSQHSRWVSDGWSSHHVRKNMDTCSQATNLLQAARAGAGAPATMATKAVWRLTQSKQSQ